jgi:hypothetical protein
MLIRAFLMLIRALRVRAAAGMMRADNSVLHRADFLTRGRTAGTIIKRAGAERTDSHHGRESALYTESARPTLLRAEPMNR